RLSSFDEHNGSSSYYSSHSTSFYSIFLFLIIPPPPRSTLFPYTTLFRSRDGRRPLLRHREDPGDAPSWGRRAASGRCATDDLRRDRKSTRLNSSHVEISYAVFCLKKKKKKKKKYESTQATKIALIIQHIH